MTTTGMAWPVPGHLILSQRFGVTTLAAELRSYEHEGYLVSDARGPKRFRLLRNGTIAGGVHRTLVHPAIDIPCPVGTLVVAGEAGVVIGQGADLTSGELWQTIKLASGVELFATHLSRFLVAKGAHVARGAAIARSGASGWVTGPHVHYEVRAPSTVWGTAETDKPADRVNPVRVMTGADLAGFIQSGRM